MAHTLDAGQQRRPGPGHMAYQWLWPLAERWRQTKDAAEVTRAEAYNNNISSRLAVGLSRYRATIATSSPTLPIVVTDALRLGVG